jgi:ferredoxin
MVKIEIDKEKCIGCGACASACDNFELREGKAHAKKAEVDEIGCNQEAADACPVEAIKIIR